MPMPILLHKVYENMAAYMGGRLEWLRYMYADDDLYDWPLICPLSLKVHLSNYLRARVDAADTLDAKWIAFRDTCHEALAIGCIRIKVIFVSFSLKTM